MKNRTTNIRKPRQNNYSNGFKFFLNDSVAHVIQTHACYQTHNLLFARKDSPHEPLGLHNSVKRTYYTVRKSNSLSPNKQETQNHYIPPWYVYHNMYMLLHIEIMWLNYSVLHAYTYVRTVGLNIIIMLLIGYHFQFC